MRTQRHKSADQLLCFRYRGSTIPLLSKSKIPSLLYFLNPKFPASGLSKSKIPSLLYFLNPKFPASGQRPEAVLTCTHYLCFEQKDMFLFFLMKSSIFTTEKNLCILRGQVFVMITVTLVKSSQQSSFQQTMHSLMAKYRMPIFKIISLLFF